MAKETVFSARGFYFVKTFFLFFIPLRNTLQKTTNYGEPCWLPYIFEGVLGYADFCVRIRKSSVRRAHACMRQHRIWKILILPVKRNKKNCLNKKKIILRERKKISTKIGTAVSDSSLSRRNFCSFIEKGLKFYNVIMLFSNYKQIVYAVKTKKTLLFNTSSGKTELFIFYSVNVL